MTEIKEVDPSSIVPSEFNERTETTDTTDSDTPNLGDSVEEIGVVEPPKVREFDGEEYDYEVIVGQRRVRAAQDADMDTLPVIVGEWTDKEALTMSISENIDSFKESVSATDRGEALLNLWGLMGGDTDEKPSPSSLSKELGVPKSTVSHWLETVNDRWKGSKTVTEPVDEDESFDSQTNEETIADKLGERKMAEIRQATDTQEESDRVAKKVFEEGLARSQVSTLRTHLEDGDDLDTAIDKVTQEEEEIPKSFTDFSNIEDTDTSTEEVDEIEDPTDASEEEDTTQDDISTQIQDIDMVEVEVEEGEIGFTLEIPERTFERAESYAADFGYDSVEELLLIETIPDFLSSDDGKETITDLLDEKAKARGY